MAYKIGQIVRLKSMDELEEYKIEVYGSHWSLEVDGVYINPVMYQYLGLKHKIENVKIYKDRTCYFLEGTQGYVWASNCFFTPSIWESV